MFDKCALSHQGNKFIVIPPKKKYNINITFLSKVLRFVFNNNEIRLLGDSRLEPRTRDKITKVFQENHDSKLLGHYGFNKTYSEIKEHYY